MSLLLTTRKLTTFSTFWTPSTCSHWSDLNSKMSNNVHAAIDQQDLFQILTTPITVTNVTEAGSGVVSEQQSAQ